MALEVYKVDRDYLIQEYSDEFPKFRYHRLVPFYQSLATDLFRFLCFESLTLIASILYATCRIIKYEFKIESASVYFSLGAFAFILQRILANRHRRNYQHFVPIDPLEFQRLVAFCRLLGIFL